MGLNPSSASIIVTFLNAMTKYLTISNGMKEGFALVGGYNSLGQRGHGAEQEHGVTFCL